jgi:hypothetical protein
VSKAVPRSTKAVRKSGKNGVAERWWKKPKNEAHADVWATLEHIRSLSTYRTRFSRHHMELYSNQNVAGNGTNSLVRERVRFNIIAQAVDTAVATIGTQKPKPMYLVSEGNFTLMQQARLRTRVLEGQLRDLKAYEKMQQAFRDACIDGDGFVHVFLDPDTGKPDCKRTLPGTVWVDPRDGISGDPYMIYYRIPVSKDALRATYKKAHPSVIDDASGPDGNDRTDIWLQQDSTIDDAMVVFAYRRPSTKDAKDGRLVVCTSAGTLADMPWDWSLPFVKVTWKKRQLGYYGSGIAEAGRDPQARILKMISRGERILDLGGNAWVVLDRNAKIRTEKLTNEPLIKVHYEGTANPPVIQSFNPKPVQIEEEVQIVREQFFAELGLNTLQAEGKKPAGLDSGAAQREYMDNTAQRHQVQAIALQDAYMDLVSKLEEHNERATERDSTYSIMAATQRGRQSLLKKVKWSSTKLPENEFRLTCWPTAQLPSTPAGKMAMVQEWIASGFISRPYAQQLVLDIPDTDGVARMELAYMDCVMADCEAMMDGKDAYPEPYQDLALAADIARRAYLQIKNDAPEDVCERFRNYIDDAMALMPKPPMPAPAPAPIDPAALPAQGMAA